MDGLEKCAGFTGTEILLNPWSSLIQVTWNSFDQPICLLTCRSIL